MSGICAGRPGNESEDMRLGDVIIASTVCRYDAGKDKGDELIHFDKPSYLGGNWARWARTRAEHWTNLAKDPGQLPSWWSEHRPKEVDSEWKVVIAPMATGESLQNNPDAWSKVSGRQWFRIPKVRGMDMEADAIACVAREHDIPFCIIKGVADHGDRPSPNWRAFAARASAEVLLDVLRHSMVPKHGRRLMGAFAAICIGAVFAGLVLFHDKHAPLSPLGAPSAKLAEYPSVKEVDGQLRVLVGLDAPPFDVVQVSAGTYVSKRLLRGSDVPQHSSFTWASPELRLRAREVRDGLLDGVTVGEIHSFLAAWQATLPFLAQFTTALEGQLDPHPGFGREATEALDRDRIRTRDLATGGEGVLLQTGTREKGVYFRPVFTLRGR